MLGAQQVVCQWEALAPKSKTGHELNFQLGESDTYVDRPNIEAEGNDTRYSPFAGKPRWTRAESMVACQRIPESR